MNLRDWLILIGAVILIVIILDGVRRMRQAKRDSLQMSRDMGGNIDSSPLDENYNPELPGGGARIVGQRGDDMEPELSESFSDRLSAVDVADAVIDEMAFRSDPKPVVAEMGESLGREMDQSVATAFAQKKATVPAVDTDTMVAQSIDRKVAAPARKSRADKKVEPVEDYFAKDSSAKDNSTKDNSTRDNVTKIARAPSEVLVINVDAKTSKGFAGSDLKRLLEACGLVHGEMSVFHRHEEDDLLSPLQFSVANGVEPGYFDPNSIETISTPRVAFFMSLPGPRDSMRAFDYMLETAQCFARNLDGELRDEHRSAITQQTIEHCRQRIREFERKQLSRNRKA